MKKTALALAMLVFLAGCANKAQTGATSGALLGATVGALTAGNKVQGAAIGAGIGLLLGYVIGNEWDKHDQQQMNRTLETSPSGQTSTWRNPDTGAYYEATPTNSYYQDNRVYRDVEMKAVVDGKEETVHAKAYRNPDGTWQLVQ
ncbi:MAG: glycine zipper domain-containing protein [Desulfovibrionaceae bacterium]